MLLGQHEQRPQIKMRKSDEEQCLNMIMNPEFVQNLKILQQGSGSTIGTSFKGDLSAVSHQDQKIQSQENVPLTLDQTGKLSEKKDGSLKPKKMIFSVQDQRVLTPSTMQNLGIPLPQEKDLGDEVK